MLNGFQVFDADAHALMTPGMWADLPDQYKLRRPRPIRVADSTDMGRWNTGWLIEGGMHPHPFGPGARSGKHTRYGSSRVWRLAARTRRRGWIPGAGW